MIETQNYELLSLYNLPNNNNIVVTNKTNEYCANNLPKNNNIGVTNKTNGYSVNNLPKNNDIGVTNKTNGYCANNSNISTSNGENGNATGLNFSLPSNTNGTINLGNGQKIQKEILNNGLLGLSGNCGNNSNMIFNNNPFNNHISNNSIKRSNTYSSNNYYSTQLQLLLNGISNISNTSNSIISGNFLNNALKNNNLFMDSNIFGLPNHQFNLIHKMTNISKFLNELDATVKLSIEILTNISTKIPIYKKEIESVQRMINNDEYLKFIINTNNNNINNILKKENNNNGNKYSLEKENNNDSKNNVMKKESNNEKSSCDNLTHLNSDNNKSIESSSSFSNVHNDLENRKRSNDEMNKDMLFKTTMNMSLQDKKRKLSNIDKGKDEEIAEKEKQDEENECFHCPICLEKANTKTEYCSTICGHIFCKKCLDTSLKKKKICPICRYDFKRSRKFSHKIFLPL